jgi:hypothetical protein
MTTVAGERSCPAVSMIVAALSTLGFAAAVWAAVRARERRASQALRGDFVDIQLGMLLGLMNDDTCDWRAAVHGMRVSGRFDRAKRTVACAGLARSAKLRFGNLRFTKMNRERVWHWAAAQLKKEQVPRHMVYYFLPMTVALAMVNVRTP